MFFFMLLYLVLVLVRPQDYPEWENLGVPVLPITLILAFLFWLPSRNKDLTAPQYLLLPAFLLTLMLSQIVNGWMGGAVVQLSTFGPAVMAFLVMSHVATDRSHVIRMMVFIVLSSVLLAIQGIQQVELGVG
nr:O-antigen polymerase [Dokdonella sp.]